MSMETPWYDLFSRGARDWLRHNEKVREGVQDNLANLISGPDLITGPQDQTVHVPVKLLEHARFRLSDNASDTQTAAGQGAGKPGDVLRQIPSMPGDDEGEGDENEGEVRLLMELKVDDIMDWLWEELKLPDLEPRRKANIESEDYVREGWDKRGARARLDRRRTVKEAIKRRAIQPNAVPFSNEDLRFRQLVHRKKPATSAVVIFALDVSASMTDAERKLAKTFFFFALQGIRRKYAKVETRFVAHTTHAWEFTENEFFQVTGTGGTGASTAFNLSLELLTTEYEPSQYNSYLFYASDGENFTEDRLPATEALGKLLQVVNYAGYVETTPGSLRTTETEMKMICTALERGGAPIGTCILARSDDVWRALRKFFVQQPAQHEVA
ncbi:MAG: DUF444 family protein [Burkholderiales bacterium]|nr:DUF444 family protein [Burkholderiales bacterium]